MIKYIAIGLLLSTSAMAQSTAMDRCVKDHDFTSPVCNAGCHYSIDANACGVVGCPNDDNLMWCLHLKSNSDMIKLHDGRVQFIPNEAMREYVRRALKND